MRRILAIILSVCMLMGIAAGTAAAQANDLNPYSLCDRASHRLCVRLAHPAQPASGQAVVSGNRSTLMVFGADEVCHGHNLVTIKPGCPFSQQSSFNQQYKKDHIIWTGWYGDDTIGLVTQPGQVIGAWSGPVVDNGNEMVQTANDGLVDVYASNVYYAHHGKSIGQYLCVRRRPGEQLYFGSFTPGVCQWAFIRHHGSAGSNTVSAAL